MNCGIPFVINFTVIRVRKDSGSKFEGNMMKVNVRFRLGLIPGEGHLFRSL